MNRPQVIINCAMSSDGKIALPNGRQLRISSDEDIARVYKLRNACDAVLVGIGTILTDDPKLTVKEKYVPRPRQPIRIILDTHCKTPEKALAANEKAKTIIATVDECSKKFNKNVEILKCKSDNEDKINLHFLLEQLFNIGIKKLLVEGGSNVIWSFINEKLFDDLYVYIGPIIIGGLQTPTMTKGEGIKNIKDLIHLKIITVSRFGNGILIHYKPNDYLN